MKTVLYLSAAIIVVALLAFFVLPPAVSSKLLLAIVVVSISAYAVLCWRSAANIPDPLDVDSLIPGEGPLVNYDASAATVKHPQMILAMDQSFFDGCMHFISDLNNLSAERFLSWHQTEAALCIRQRSGLETNEAYRQILPYVVLRQTGNDGTPRYYAYRRTKQVGEQRLAGKCSIGVGGHIDAESVCFRSDSTIDLRATILHSAWRELSEELMILDALTGNQQTLLAFRSENLTFGDIFITHDDGVQRVHLGVVLYLDVPAGITVDMAEPELDGFGWYTSRDLQMYFDGAGGVTLEVWSQLLADHFAEVAV